MQHARLRSSSLTQSWELWGQMSCSRRTSHCLHMRATCHQPRTSTKRKWCCKLWQRIGRAHSKQVGLSPQPWVRNRRLYHPWKHLDSWTWRRQVALAIQVTSTPQCHRCQPYQRDISRTKTAKVTSIRPSSLTTWSTWRRTWGETRL